MKDFFLFSFCNFSRKKNSAQFEIERFLMIECFVSFNALSPASFAENGNIL